MNLVGSGGHNSVHSNKEVRIWIGSELRVPQEILCTQNCPGHPNQALNMCCTLESTFTPNFPHLPNEAMIRNI